MVSLNYAPEPVGIGKYSGELGAWLASRGHAVRVITAPPYFPAWRLGEGVINRYCRERRQGVELWRCPLWVPRRPTGLTRLLHLLSFALSSAPVVFAQSDWQPQLVITVAPALFCAPAVLILKWRVGCPAWLHVQDFELDAAFELGILQGGSLRRLAEQAERWLLRCFDRVSSISSAMVQRLHAKGVDPERCQLLPNWVDLREIKPQESAESQNYRQALGIGADQLVLLYSGSMNRKQGLEQLEEVIRSLRQRRDLVWVFAGEGPGQETMAQRCQGLAQVRLTGLQPPEHLAAWLAFADVHLLPQKAAAADLVLPSKLLGMLASGRPLIATSPAGSDLARLASEAGRCVPPGDREALRAAVLELCDNAELRLRCGARARELAEQYFDRDRLLPGFEQQLAKMVAA